nr:MAG TPA: hypothetical protein [Caudoviricetes sp.]
MSLWEVFNIWLICSQDTVVISTLSSFFLLPVL